MPRWMIVSWFICGGAVGAQSPTHVWSRSLEGRAGVSSIAIDRSGSVLMTGGFAWTLNCGGIDLVSAGYSDIFIAKYNSDGTHLWSWRYGGEGEDRAQSLAVDSSDNLFVAGVAAYGTDLGDGAPLSFADKIFVAKYNTLGLHCWSHQFDAMQGSVYSIVVDSSGNVLVTGDFMGLVNLGGSDLVSAGISDVFLAKYNSDGVHQWSRSFGGPSWDIGTALAVDSQENVVVTGLFQEGTNLGGADLVSSGRDDAFIAKYNADGMHLWSQRAGGASIDVANSLIVDRAGNILLAGRFWHISNFGGSNLVSQGSADIFVAKFGTEGTHQWSLAFGGPEFQDATGIAIDDSDDVFVTGGFYGSMNFGADGLVSAGLGDIFVAKFAADGVLKWSKRFGGTASDGGSSIAARSNWFILAGFFSDTVDFGGGALEGGSGSHPFLAKFADTPVRSGRESFGSLKGQFEPPRMPGSTPKRQLQ